MNNYVLALETSVKQGSVCLLFNDQTLDHWICPENVSMSECVLPEIDALLKRNNIILNDIKLIAVSTGPGSFTGIRVGISTAKALAFSIGCEIRGVSIFQAMACASASTFVSDSKGKILCIAAAGRNEFFCQEFLSDRETISECSQVFLIKASDNVRGFDFEDYDEVIFEKSSYDNFIKVFPDKEVPGSNTQKVKIAEQNLAKLIGQCASAQRNSSDKNEKSNLSAVYGREVTIGR